MKTTWNIVKNFGRVWATVTCILFVIPVHYALWKRKHPDKGIEQYIGERDIFGEEK